MIVNIKGQKIFFREYGEGLPIIILHGFYLDSLTMINAIEDRDISLEGFRRIYVDLPGMGDSPAHTLENNADTMLDLLSEMVDFLIADRSFIVIGFSYGGYLAQGIAKRFRHQVIGEVLICPVVIPDHALRTPARIFSQEIDGKFLKSLSTTAQEDLLKDMVVINQRTYERSQADFARAIARADDDFLKVLYEPKNYTSTYIEKDTSIHDHKSLMFLGYQDNVVGYQDMMDRLVRYPRATVSLMTNASHSFFLEQPKEFERKLNSWLSQYK